MMSGRWQYFSCNSVSRQTLGHVQESSNAAAFETHRTCSNINLYIF